MEGGREWSQIPSIHRAPSLLLKPLLLCKRPRGWNLHLWSLSLMLWASLQHPLFLFLSRLLGANIYLFIQQTCTKLWTHTESYGYKENYSLGLPSRSSPCSWFNLPTPSLTHSLIYSSLTRSILWATHIHCVYISSCLWTQSNYSRSLFPEVVWFPVFFSYFSSVYPDCAHTQNHRKKSKQRSRKNTLFSHISCGWRSSSWSLEGREATTESFGLSSFHSFIHSFIYLFSKLLTEHHVWARPCTGQYRKLK